MSTVTTSPPASRRPQDALDSLRARRLGNATASEPVAGQDVFAAVFAVIAASEVPTSDAGPAEPPQAPPAEEKPTIAPESTAAPAPPAEAPRSDSRSRRPETTASEPDNAPETSTEFAKQSSSPDKTAETQPSKAPVNVKTAAVRTAPQTPTASTDAERPKTPLVEPLEEPAVAPDQGGQEASSRPDGENNPAAAAADRPVVQGPEFRRTPEAPHSETSVAPVEAETHQSPADDGGDRRRSRTRNGQTRSNSPAAKNSRVRTDAPEVASAAHRNPSAPEPAAGETTVASKASGLQIDASEIAGTPEANRATTSPAMVGVVQTAALATAGIRTQTAVGRFGGNAAGGNAAGVNAAGVNAAGGNAAGGTNGRTTAASPTAGPSTAAVANAKTAAVKEKGVDTADKIARVRLVQRVSKAFHHLGRDGGNVRMRLAPDALGSMTLDMRVRGGAVEASVVTDHPAAAEAIRQNLSELRTRLEQGGLRVDRLEVKHRQEKRRQN